MNTLQCLRNQHLFDKRVLNKVENKLTFDQSCYPPTQPSLTINKAAKHIRWRMGDKTEKLSLALKAGVQLQQSRQTWINQVMTQALVLATI